MLARPTMRQELPAALRPDSSGLFTPPAEPFLPPVDTNTPTPASPPAAPSLSLAMLQDRLEFRSLDEPDEAASARSRPMLQSHILSKSLPARALISLEAEERERAKKFRQLKALEFDNVSGSPSQPAVHRPTSGDHPNTTSMPRMESISTVSAPAMLERVTKSPHHHHHHHHHSEVSRPGMEGTVDDEEEVDSVESEELPPLILDLPPPRTAPARQVIELTLDTDPPPLVSSETNLNNSPAANSSSVVLKRNQKAQPKSLQTSGSKHGTTRPSRGQTRESSRIRAPSKQPPLFPDTLRALDRPREAMQQCFQHLESPEWEMTVQGLQTLVRLLRHHPEVPQAHIHVISVALGKHVRNLRSQVSRAACQACGELFDSLRRAVEPELEEVAGPLFHRAADTNKFLRADCNAALDKMVDAITPARAVAVIIAKGSSHQNAIVRTAAARLLLNLVTKLGPERVMLSPRETRDKILLTGANFLTEGSLDTRCFAKQLFRALGSHHNFTTILTEVLPAPVMRNISKTLQSLK